MNNWFKTNWKHIAAIVFLIVLAFVYVSPVMDGKRLAQSDIMQATAMQKEIKDNLKPDGTGPLWTNQMFGGMPSYQIWIQYPNNIATYINRYISIIFPNPANMIVMYLIGAYILFAVMGVNVWLSLLGAIAIAFSSYNFIIIEAGHMNKAIAIGYFPILLAGVFLIFDKRWIWGAVMLSLGMAVELRSGHIQMTYYLFIAIGLYFVYQAIQTIRNKAWMDYGKAVIISGLAIGIGVSINATNLMINSEYVKETMRGGTELTLTDGDKKVSKGLDKDYAYQWSQGIGECTTFLIPNAYGGGGRTEMPKDGESVKLLVGKGVAANQAEGFVGQFAYWGPKPFTSGPTYFGCVIFFLFVLGLVIVRNPLKWWILSAVVLSILLSLGKHFEGFSNLFFDYVPMYNKFRAVESILVIAALLIPVLAVMTVQEIAEAKDDELSKLINKGKKVVYGFAALLAILWLAPSMVYDFQGQNDENVRQQMMQMSNGDEAFSNQMVTALQEDRASLFKADTLRSFLFIAMAIAVLYLLATRKLKSEYALMALAVLVLVDMWSVDKRYLNNEAFVSKSKVKNYFQPREVDLQIMQDKDPNYRVFDVSVNTFGDATPSYFHKTVGGYNAVKLRRINDIITHQLTGDSTNQEVLNMLNTKYFIIADKASNQAVAIPNPNALGNAWFVRKATAVKGANEEMLALRNLQPKTELVYDEQFKADVKPIEGRVDTFATIHLTSYSPEKLVYDYESTSAQTAVFSEIYYKAGWKAYLDGKEVPYFRANYILRAMQVPSGKHTIVFEFKPETFYLGEKISLAGSVVLMLLIGGGLFMNYRKKD